MSLKYLLCGMAFVACATIARAFNNVPESISASIFLKVPGNDAKRYPLTFQKSQNNNGTYYLENSEKMPLTVSQNIVTGNDGLRISTLITVSRWQQISVITIAYSICRGSGIGVICVRPRKPLHFILQTVGL